MLKKEQVEVLLNRAMKSEADFAEIFEEETHTQSMTQLDDNVGEYQRERTRRSGDSSV